VRFLFCDRILELEPGKRALATKMVSLSEEFLPDHYARQPVMPSTMVMECLAQLAALVLCSDGELRHHHCPRTSRKAFPSWAWCVPEKA